MQAKTDARAAETASLLESFGIELSAGGLVVMTDFAKAESCPDERWPQRTNRENPPGPCATRWWLGARGS